MIVRAFVNAWIQRRAQRRLAAIVAAAQPRAQQYKRNSDAQKRRVQA